MVTASLLPKAKRVGITQISINGRMDKHTGVRSHRGILYIHEKEGPRESHDSMGAPHSRRAEGGEPDTSGAHCAVPCT